MNGQTQAAAGPEQVSQESLLLAAVERIVRIRDGRIAVHLHLSRLLPQNRQESHIRIALRILEPMVNAYRGQMFLLGDCDVVFLVKDANPTDVENMVFKLRALFSKDPLTFTDKGDGIDRFCTWFHLETSEYDALLDVARAAEEEAKRRGREKRESGPELIPLKPGDLGRVLETLAGVDVTGLIRRQSAIVITERNTAEVLFQEFFVAMGELQKAVGGGLNLLSNRWLFQHLSVTLDQLVLDALAKPLFQVPPGVFSLNLNLASVQSAHFARFEKAMKGRAKISVELQILDVLANSGTFFKVRDDLHAAGHLVVIDGLNVLTTKFMDISQFGADLHKVAWSPELPETEKNLLSGSNVTPASLVLARCDSEAAIRWGLGHGIGRFQGRYVDSMLAAYTMARCEKAPACTLQQCVERRAMVAGTVRDQCCNLNALDTSPVMRVPGIQPKPKAEKT